MCLCLSCFWVTVSWSDGWARVGGGGQGLSTGGEGNHALVQWIKSGTECGPAGLVAWRCVEFRGQIRSGTEACLSAELHCHSIRWSSRGAGWAHSDTPVCSPWMGTVPAHRTSWACSGNLIGEGIPVPLRVSAETAGVLRAVADGAFLGGSGSGAAGWSDL